MKKQSTEGFTNDKFFFIFIFFRIFQLEEKISNIKDENENLSKKITLFKSKQCIKAKELEVYQKEFPMKISKLTDQVNILASKKFGNYGKINKNKKSLKNMKIYLESMYQLYNSHMRKAGLYDQRNLEKIHRDLEKLNTYLKYNDEEIINKINTGEFKHTDFTLNNHNLANINNSNEFANQLKNKTGSATANSKHYRSLSPKGNYTNQINNKTLPMINVQKHYESPKKQQLLSLNKFEYLTQKENVGNPHYMAKIKKSSKIKELTEKREDKINQEKNENLSENTISEADENREDDIRRSFYTSSDEEIPEIRDLDNFVKILELELNYDYEHSTEEDFSFLVGKNEEFVKLNEKISKILGNVELNSKNKLILGRKKYTEMIRRTNVLKQVNKKFNLSKMNCFQKKLKI